MRVVSYEDLRPLGIPYSRVHLHRLERAGKFPQRVRISANRIVWLESEVKAWFQAAVEARDAKPAA